VTYQEGCKTPINLDWAWRGEQWVVDMISDVQREQPIVGTVLEEIEEGHRCMREPVHEQSFQKSFGVVQRPAASCNTANNVHFLCCVDSRGGYGAGQGLGRRNEVSKESIQNRDIRLDVKVEIL
jgi:hypothetical protein